MRPTQWRVCLRHWLCPDVRHRQVALHGCVQAALPAPAPVSVSGTWCFHFHAPRCVTGLPRLPLPARGLLRLHFGALGGSWLTLRCRLQTLSSETKPARFGFPPVQVQSSVP